MTRIVLKSGEYGLSPFWIYVDEPIEEALARVPEAIKAVEALGETNVQMNGIEQLDPAYIHLPSKVTL